MPSPVSKMRRPELKFILSMKAYFRMMFLYSTKHSGHGTSISNIIFTITYNRLIIFFRYLHLLIQRNSFAPCSKGFHIPLYKSRKDRSITQIRKFPTIKTQQLVRLIIDHEKTWTYSSLFWASFPMSTRTHRSMHTNMIPNEYASAKMGSIHIYNRNPCQ